MSGVNLRNKWFPSISLNLGNRS